MSDLLLSLLNSNLLETVSTVSVPPRRARLSDFLDEDEDTCCQNNSNNNHKYNQNYSQNDHISKHQQEFGHRKRIKP